MASDAKRNGTRMNTDQTDFHGSESKNYYHQIRGDPFNPCSSASHSSGPVGLLAGGGRFPIVFAQKARSLGRPVVCVGIRGQAEPELAREVPRFYWAGPGRLGRMIRLFKRSGVRQIVMAGKVTKADILHKPWKAFTLLPDWRMVCWWYFRHRRDNKD